MNPAHEPGNKSDKVTDRVDDELLCFYARSFHGIHRPIKAGQVVTYAVEVDANGRRYATDIRFEDDDGSHKSD